MMKWGEDGGYIPDEHVQWLIQRTASGKAAR